ncbi:N-acetyl-gamma-glutamyl-phosphate reductase [Chitinivibrio alkaliphilus]|uniref:N-acetyl-gamma-glutamyl-phosphate reductase n=1 Tax=Chitinivibrio alkaliphilus ACht1 TaxID=1313304 RepID=U7D9A2_9BACT|nr:N-acetyl-gamma-glutamyl-phosphate reductase [Chitinivibrio alkaliphilus]ERP38969.1 N-acetyl-gamma-glutamyl-phosphate reductase [Chitinivibrio alkaliphilus ACht1]
MRKRVFIDGQVGTTGLQIHERLKERSDIEIVEIDHELRKSKTEKAAILNSVDLAILCLPDEPAREAVALLDSHAHTKIIDASTAHRTAPGWTYGFPELDSSFRNALRESRFISNPGCHASGFIALIYPLISDGILGIEQCLSLTSLTGYSGGGKGLIAEYEEQRSESHAVPPRPYALNLSHKHLPEMQGHTGLIHAPHFFPVVGDFYRGMLVSVPLFLRDCHRSVSVKNIREIYQEYYDQEPFMKVYEENSDSVLEAGKFLSPTACNETNTMELFVYGSEEQALLMARFDNLGKGASGAAVQNMNIALGLDEQVGLIS